MTDQQPLLRIVNADATPEEIAAVVAVLSALGGASPAPRVPRAAWQHPHRALRANHPHGQGGWRASALPR